VSRPDFTFGDLPEADPDTIEQVPTPDPPRRPLIVVFASAVLLIGGAFGIIQRVADPLIVSGGPPAIDLVLILSFGLDGLSIVAGILLRSGRMWIVGANVSAVFAFLWLSLMPNPIAVFFGSLYLFVVVASFLARGWFSAMGDWRVAVEESRLRR